MKQQLITVLTLGLIGLTTYSCSEEAEVVPIDAHPLTLHLNCGMDDVLSPTARPEETRASYDPNPFYENVIYTLFVLHFDKDGICRNCTDLDTISGSQTSTTYTLELQDVPAFTTNNTLYVFCNMDAENYNDIKSRYRSLTLSAFKEEMFSIASFREREQGNETYLPSYGLFTGTIQDDMSLNILLARYLARVSVSVAMAKEGTSCTNVRVGIVRAPKRLLYIPVDRNADYPVLDAESPTDFFPAEEMQDLTPIASVSKTTSTTETTRYFYLGENLSPDSALQSKVRITGTMNGSAFDVQVPLTSSGVVDRNSNYELVVKVQ